MALFYFFDPLVCILSLIIARTDTSSASWRSPIISHTGLIVSCIILSYTMPSTSLIINSSVCGVDSLVSCGFTYFPQHRPLSHPMHPILWTHLVSPYRTISSDSCSLSIEGCSCVSFCLSIFGPYSYVESSSRTLDAYFSIHLQNHDSDMTGHTLEHIINGPAHHTLHHLYFTVNYGQVPTATHWHDGVIPSH